ncbi:hypothetical protein M3194_28420 [Paenibacillus glycanilyticus]|uniref:hypothetical protein n=1 Tax=Paenibacillus glycanilyticus TaxID=126569 RepID=UPI00203EAF7F|nr:hypothetical protein [Paenibacillus glycanilyticus]MCM3631232.1 hypothetical protein [Paenibacillus glycanilyticus]
MAVVSVKSKCHKRLKPMKCKKGPVKRSGTKQVVNLLNTISTQLTGINNNLNNDLNNLSTVINTGNTNLNSNLAASLSTLNADLHNALVASSNTIVRNMNTINQPNCSIERIRSYENFWIPCGTNAVLFNNQSMASSEKVFITAASNQFWGDGCQAVLVIVTLDGTVIERPLPPMLPPTFTNQEIQIIVDNYASIVVRCESVGPTVPEGGFCSGYVQITDFVCICCSPENAG